MSRPPLEVADLIRTAGTAFIERNRQWIRWTHIKVLVAIARCRTAALGGHIDECTRGGHRATISYNSCRNRHCPKCQTGARQRWIQARRRELLPSPYVHVVFTLPPQLAALALQNKKDHLWFAAAGQRRNSVAIPIAGPFPIIDWSRWPTAKSPFVGATRLTPTPMSTN